jgi:hypothetical protein
VRLVAFSVLLAASAARADSGDTVAIGAAVGAGGQGSSTYGALELRLDALWRDVRIGLGGRAVVLDGAFRTADWNEPADALSVIRLVEAHTPGKALALAGGALAPLSIGNLSDAYRPALDDRPRTGARITLATRPVSGDLVIDDVRDPALAGGALDVRLTRSLALRAGALVDPSLGEAAIELALARTWRAAGRALDLGAGAIVEPGAGVHALAYAALARDVRGARLSGRADLRAGTGTVGGAFGPLYRAEREMLWNSSGADIGAGLSAGVIAPAGWLAASARLHAVGAVASISGGAPLNRWLQAVAWAAASRNTAAGAAAIHVQWARRFASALEVARMIDTDAMSPSPVWSATAWFAATSN